MRRRQAAVPFLTLGVGLIAVGLAGNKTFLYVGLPFLILGFAMLRRG
jgi:hypothetical protein